MVWRRVAAVVAAVADDNDPNAVVTSAKSERRQQGGADRLLIPRRWRICVTMPNSVRPDGGGGCYMNWQDPTTSARPGTARLCVGLDISEERHGALTPVQTVAGLLRKNTDSASCTSRRRVGRTRGLSGSLGGGWFWVVR
jgi:hypothetical protein